MNLGVFSRGHQHGPRDLPAGPLLSDHSRVGVLGGGPAGSFFAYFVLDLSQTLGRDLEVEIYESRDFQSPAPAGCNMCGGIVSESLVQFLAAEGIPLPPTVIQRGIDSYTLHMEVGSVRIETPLREMRVGAVHRASGPRDVGEARWGSFDAYLQSKAVEKGARVIHSRVDGMRFTEGRPEVHTMDGSTATYDLLVVAGGVNSDVPQMLEKLGIGYQAPATTTTFIREYRLGHEALERTLGSSMHVFLLDIPRLHFAAIIPKGEYATVCLLGESLDKKLADAFMDAPAVRACFAAAGPLPARSCQCSPRINVRGAPRSFADRLLVLGDCGVTRLYKDGIGSAYRTAKVAAATAVFHGISANSFERYLRPAIDGIRADNRIGRLTFAMTHLLQKHPVALRAVLRMTEREQRMEGSRRRMSQILWDVFTGSAPYRTVVTRMAHPDFLCRFAGSLLAAPFSRRPGSGRRAGPGAARGGEG